MNASTKKSLSLLIALSGAVACGAFVGCSSTDTTINPDNGGDGGTIVINNDGATTVTNDGATTTDDGSTGSDDGSIPDAGPAGPSTTGAGTVSLSASATGYSASASFAYTPETTTSACPGPVEITGTTCTFYTNCAPAAVVDAGTPADSGTDAALATPPNAGDIVITGGQLPTAGVKLTAEATGTYAPVTGTASPFNGGDKLTFTAGEGDANSLAAFTISDVLAPATITITAPTFTTGTAPSTSIDRSADLAVAWSSGQTGTKFTVTVSTINLAGAATQAAGYSKQVTCTFDGGADKGTIPSANGLALLDKADGMTVYGSFLVSTSSTGTAVSKDNSDTSVAGSQFNVTALVSGAPFSGTFKGGN